MQWREYFNVDLWKIVWRHCTGALTIVIPFRVTGWVIGLFLEQGDILNAIEFIDKIVTIAGVVYLALALLWEFGTLFYRMVKGGQNGSPHAFVVA